MRNNDVDLIIFDVDDVLVHSHDVFSQNTFTAARTVRLDVEPLEKYFDDIKCARRTPVSPVERLVRIMWPTVPTTKHDAFVRTYQACSRATKYCEIPNARATLLWLKERGVAMAICSNAHGNGLSVRFATARIPHLLFAHVAHPNNGHAKPDSRAFDGIFASIPVRREKTIFVGDMITDFETAQNTGTQFLAVLTGITQRETFVSAGVDTAHILNSVADLPQFISEY